MENDEAERLAAETERELMIKNYDTAIARLYSVPPRVGSVIALSASALGFFTGSAILGVFHRLQLLPFGWRIVAIAIGGCFFATICAAVVMCLEALRPRESRALPDRPEMAADLSKMATDDGGVAVARAVAQAFRKTTEGLDKLNVTRQSLLSRAITCLEIAFCLSVLLAIATLALELMGV